ncbi:hypothetical protein PF008_g14377 [Phytophthora fragariae]|uniref:Uncharacterized protein n=1 Tax=Phytophthora fragariae TaxID=53985 RepID=A0A6G0RI24_9STRA|nr:hypothetical protein PF008_g14377 [Phytophthora fragariae]
MSQLELSFRVALDHLNNTGAGKTVGGSLLEWIGQKCPHYEVLNVVMVERPATRPMATNEDSDFDVAGQSVEEPCFSGEEDASTTELAAGSTSVGTTGIATTTTSGVITTKASALKRAAATTGTGGATTVATGQGKPHDQRTNSTKRIGSIRVRNTRVASTLSEWGDINSTLAKS